MSTIMFTGASSGTGISLDPQALGRVHRPGAQRLRIFEPTIEESDIRPILERKLQALGTVAENRESLLSSLDNIKPEPASVIWGKRTMKRPTNKELSAELETLKAEYEKLHTQYAKQVETIGKLSHASKQQAAEIQNLRQQLAVTARAAASLATVIEHFHNHAP